MNIPELIAQLQAAQAIHGDDIPLVMRLGMDGEVLTLDNPSVEICTAREGGHSLLMLDFNGEEVRILPMEEDDDEDDGDDDGDDDEDEDEDEDDSDDDGDEVRTPAPLQSLSILIARFGAVLAKHGDVPVLLALDDYDLNVLDIQVIDAGVDGKPVLLLEPLGEAVETDADDDEDEDEGDDAEEDEVEDPAEAAKWDETKT